MRTMDLGLVGTVVLFAVILATVAGIAAARVLMRAAETGALRRGASDEPGAVSGTSGR